MPANYVFTYLHCLGSGCVGVIPAECDLAKSQDVACVCMCRRCKTVARAQETEFSEMARGQIPGGEDCFFSFSELSQFMISSPLNSIESDGRGRCLTRMDLMKRSMESRVLELLGKMKIGPFAFGLWCGRCLAVSQQRSDLLLIAKNDPSVQQHVCSISVLVSMLFVCIELPFKCAKEMQRIWYDKWDESLKDLIYN